MTDASALLLSLLAGTVLGTLFFGSLWWTIRKGLTSKRSASLFLTSLLLRMGVLVAGFYFVGRGHPQRMGACLIGFVLARLIVTQMVSRAP